jgi:hypothetical protein
MVLRERVSLYCSCEGVIQIIDYLCLHLKGKTLTAEAVAESLRRPLYMVSSAQLEGTASSLEVGLKTILQVGDNLLYGNDPLIRGQLGTAWDAVILIDEADVSTPVYSPLDSVLIMTYSQVFLEQRSLHDVGSLLLCLIIG